MQAILFIKDHGVERARKVVKGAPAFIREALDQDETMYNARTEKYIERGVQSALIQLEEDEYFHTTMPYTSAFYDECVLLSDLKRLVESVEYITELGGLEAAKENLCNLYAMVWVSISIEILEQAIADYEQIYSGAEQ